MTEIYVSDKSNIVYKIAGWTLGELNAARDYTGTYILKPALHRILRGDSSTNRIRVRSKNGNYFVRVKEYEDGSMAIGCRKFLRHEACVIRGWAYE